jgi:S-adenosylmethionine:tRNA ribosyltransferase-isomerase
LGVLASAFEFSLPPELIAQAPASSRDHSRLLVLRRPRGEIAPGQFADFPGCLRRGDVLVLNDSKVIPARLRGINARTGGEFELLLLEEAAVNDWWTMVRPGKRARTDTRIILRNRDGDLTRVHARIIDKNSEGHRRLHFAGTPNLLEDLPRLGETPLPPYLKRKRAANLRTDRERYQTVYAREAGSIAAPTAGLHFTPKMLERIRGLGVKICFVTLHVGLGTFAPVKTKTLAGHVMHAERFHIAAETARIVNQAKRAGDRVIAVGTTTLRALETAGQNSDGRIVAGAGRTRMFIHPPFDFRIVDGLLTNFHLPRSTLLMLVSAFAAPKETQGRAVVLSAYAEAVRQRYRFFSYGDAMLIL